MSPDTLIVGEVREGFTAEAMRSAMQSGHAGFTLHARLPGRPFERIANRIEIAEQVPLRDASIATIEK